jgi:hypothetical protein
MITEIFIYFLMPVGSFDELLQHIWNDISGSYANMRRKLFSSRTVAGCILTVISN